MSNSCALGPMSFPLTSAGSSECKTCGPMDIVWAYLNVPELTETFLGMVPP
jgi:hypothetical protein